MTIVPIETRDVLPVRIGVVGEREHLARLPTDREHGGRHDRREQRLEPRPVGQKAEVKVDSYPKEVFQAEVEQVNQKAEFLPRNVQTRAERIHQMFGVKLRINDPSGKVMAGMAADVKLGIEQK